MKGTLLLGAGTFVFGVVGMLGFLGGSAISLAADTTFLERYSATYRFRLGRPASIQMSPDGKTVLFLRAQARDFRQDLYELDLARGRERVLLTATDLLGGRREELSEEEKARRERMRVAARGIASYAISKDGARLLIPLGEQLFVYDRAKQKLQTLPNDGGYPIDPQFSPDGNHIACVREGELYVIDLQSGRQRRLTQGATESVTHGLAEFVAQEEMGRYHGYWWSPDSKTIAYQRTDTAELETMHIPNAVHPELAPSTWPYPRPGKPNASVTLGLLPIDGGETRWIEWDRNAYEYLATVKWSENAPLTLLVQNRQQTEQQLLAVNVRDGSTRELFTERDAAWLELDQEVPAWSPDGQRFLWITERNGAKQLELRQRDGKLKRALTQLDFGFQQLEWTDWEEGLLVVRASKNPTQRHVYRLSLDDQRSSPVALTRRPGLHDVVSRGPGERFVVASQLLDGPRSYTVYDRRGPHRGSQAAPVTLTSVAEASGIAPNLEFVMTDSDPSFHAVIIRPEGFDRNRRYPVIVHVYGGPTSQMVLADPSQYLLDQWFADHGYIVVSIDGRGTPNRGRDWQRVVKHDLIDVPLGDQVLGLKALGKRYPELDLNRVGIYGWSFGGYFSAMAVMREPDVFHVGVAGAPVVDWQDYDTHYTERYMDLPQRNSEGYRAANVLTYAERLSRPLLVIHGTDDDNVYFVHSLKLANALFRAGKDFEFLPLPGFTHMVPDPLVTRRLYGRILNLFHEALQPDKP